jgi:hypothetical protein
MSAVNGVLDQMKSVAQQQGAATAKAAANPATPAPGLKESMQTQQSNLTSAINTVKPVAQRDQQLAPLGKAQDMISKVKAVPPVANPNLDFQAQIERVMSQDSPILQRARQGANDQMALRGLKNSTMAIQAGEEAVLNSASDIARENLQTERLNQQQMHDMNMQDRGFEHDTGMQDSRFTHDDATNELNFKNQLELDQNRTNNARLDDFLKSNTSSNDNLTTQIATIMAATDIKYKDKIALVNQLKNNQKTGMQNTLDTYKTAPDFNMFYAPKNSGTSKSTNGVAADMASAKTMKSTGNTAMDNYWKQQGFTITK